MAILTMQELRRLPDGVEVYRADVNYPDKVHVLVLHNGNDWVHTREYFLDRDECERHIKVNYILTKLKG